MVLIGKRPHEIPSFGGGIVDSQAPSALNPSECCDSLNLIPYGSKLITRPGLSVVNPGGIEPPLDPVALALRSILFHFDPDTEVRTIISGTRVGFLYFDPISGTNKYIPLQSGLVSTSGAPWFRAQVQGVSYWTRIASGGLLRVLPTAANRAGIAAPSVAPVIADGGAGVMEAGDYVVVIAYRNSKTGAVSDYGLTSNTLTLAAGRSISVTGIPLSPDWQVDSRAIGVTLANRPGTYYESPPGLPDATSTAYLHNVANIDLPSEPLTLFNQPPPGNVKILAWWEAAQALVLSDGKTVFVSETGLPESYDLGTGGPFFDFTSDDGHEIRGVLPIGRTLLVGKSNRIDVLSGLTREDFRRDEFVKGYGVASGYSMRAIGSTAFWLAYTEDGLAVVRCDLGGQPVVISDKKVDTYLAQMPIGHEQICEGHIWEKYSLYLLSISLGLYSAEGINIPEVTLAYNYRTGAWGVLSFNAQAHIQTELALQTAIAPISFADYHDGITNHLYCVFNYTGANPSGGKTPVEFIYHLDGDTDSGAEINWSWLSKGYVAPANRKHKPLCLHLHMKHRRPGNMTLSGSIYKDGDVATAIKSRSWVVPIGGPKTYKLSMMPASNLATMYQMKLAAAGQVELHQGLLEAIESSVEPRLAPLDAVTPED